MRLLAREVGHRHAGIVGDGQSESHDVKEPIDFENIAGTFQQVKRSSCGFPNHEAQIQRREEEPVERETCECDEHGERWMTFVCAHIAEASINDKTVGFVCYPADGEDDLRDAWCDSCEEFLEAHGGEWVDGECEVPGGIKILCSECYRKARRLAAEAGRLRIM